MTITSKIIANMRCRWKIDKNLETLLLKRLGTEPSPYAYTEQDLYEQARKIVAQCNSNNADVLLNPPEPDVVWPIDSTKETGG